MKLKKIYIGIDIFSGAGGLSLGATNAGITISTAIEKDRNAANTFKRNHPDTKLLVEDIANVNPDLCALEHPLIVFGGSPCQGFSFSNSKTRNERNKNNVLYHEFIRFISSLKPAWFLFENVEGIMSFNGGKTVWQLIKIFEELGYTVSNDVLNASDYGVPQDRNRFILVGNKKGIHFDFPKKKKIKVSVMDAIGDLPFLVNGQLEESLPYKHVEDLPAYAKKMRNRSKSAKQNFVSKNNDLVIERYKYIKPGQNWRAIPDYLMQNYKNKNNCHSGIYKRLNPAIPSVVISNYRKNMLIHPEQDRGLSVREAARIQSFPDDFIFEGNLMSIQQQIGNAVPPLLAEAIFKQIMRYECQSRK
ncbi:MAG: DNA cytosine methyltransferase [Candidatus Electrothrix sp. Rat3]|nr:DNA cytosine methyltransferase [Candidatus Electrothrix rattekaaiensis]